MGKGKIIIPIAVIVTIVIASVASYYLYHFLSGSNGNSGGHFSHLRSEVNQLSSQEAAEHLSLQEPIMKKACDISPGVPVRVSGGETEEEVFADGENDDGDYYNSNDNPEDNQLATEGSEE